MGVNQGIAEGHFVGKRGTQGRNQGFVQPRHTTWALLKAEVREAVTQQCLETMRPNQSQLLSSQSKSHQILGSQVGSAKELRRDLF